MYKQLLLAFTLVLKYQANAIPVELAMIAW